MALYRDFGFEFQIPEVNMRNKFQETSELTGKKTIYLNDELDSMKLWF
jgi:hypothetical protein